MSKRKASAKPRKPWDRMGISKSTFYRKKRRNTGRGGRVLDLARLAGLASDPMDRTASEAEAAHRAREVKGVTTVDVGAVVQDSVDRALIENFLAYMDSGPRGPMVVGTLRSAQAMARGLRAAGYGASTGTTV